MPLIDRPPTHEETRLFQLFLSFFSNGMGWETEGDGSTRIGWRQMERVVSYFYSGSMHEEDKHVFDVICPTWGVPDEKIGLSVKSKELKQRKQYFSEQVEDTRLYLEIANSPAKFWDELKKDGITESDYGDEKLAQRMGERVLGLVESWHFDAFRQDQSLNAEKSRYLVISYGGWDESIRSRRCALHSFGLALPPAKWTFSSGRCLRGICPITNSVLWDWYGLSGGQLKYYPRAETALFQTTTFELLRNDSTPFIDLVEEQFGDQSALIKSLSRNQRKLF